MTALGDHAKRTAESSRPAVRERAHAGVRRSAWHLLPIVSLGLGLIPLGPVAPSSRAHAAEPSPEASRTERARTLARTLTQEATVAYDRRDYAKAQQLLEAAYQIFGSEKIQYSL